MAIIALEVPNGVAQYLSRLGVPGQVTPNEEMHVTIVQMDCDLTTVDAATVVGIVKDATENVRAFSVVLDHVDCFPANDNGVPIICPVKSDGLHVLHDIVAEALDARGIEYSKRFPTYRPHVTVSWSQEAVEPMSLVRPIEWTASHVAMWPYGRGAEQAVKYPLRRSASR